MTTRLVAPLLSFALIVGVSLALIPTHGSTDVDEYWMPWTRNVAGHGLTEGYRASQSDGPPLCFLILWAVNRAGAFFGLSPHLALKVSLAVSLWLTSGILYGITRSLPMALWVSLGLAIPGIGLAYLDVYLLPPMLLALWAFREGRTALGAGLYCLSCLIKFQPVIAAPVFLYYLWSTKRLTAAVLLPLILLLAATFAFFGAEPASAFWKALNHPFLSGQALNFHWAMGALYSMARGRGPLHGSMLTPGSMAIVPLKILFLCAYFLVLGRCPPKDFPRFLRTALLCYLTYFTFNVGVHENHLMTAIPFAALMAARDRRAWEPLLVLVAFSNLNTILFYGIGGTPLGALDLPYLDLALSIGFTGWTIRQLGARVLEPDSA